MKKLLSYAINDWPGSTNDLRGCINDQENIVSHLKEFGFEAITFRNEQVTRDLFRSELTKFVQSADSGDIIVVHYSGHGTQLIDTHGDEKDGYDEALYLYDGPFSDDEFSSILSQLKDLVVCVFIMDSCFSGTVTRALDVRPRFKPIFAEVDGNGSPIKRNKKIRAKEVQMNHILLTGCRDDQTSADALINGKWNGALTYSAMKNLEPGLTYKQWHEKIRKWLASKGYTQVPQLEGPDYLLDMGVFGSEIKKRKCFFKRIFEAFARPVEPIPPNPPTNPTNPQPTPPNPPQK